MLDQPSERVSATGKRSVAIGALHGGIVHTGDNHFFASPQPLPEPVAQVQNFLDAYLGTPGRPVAFGGRELELKALDSWLTDLSCEPYLLLTAPAGRGKSALLARWMASLAGEAHPLVDVVYHPVSIRYETNRQATVFSSIAAQLARLRGEEANLRNSIGSSPEHWRNLVAEYLRTPASGRQTLLILDGLDEAAGWVAGPALFPPRPPPGLRIVAAARQTAHALTPRHWLASLDWERPGLARSMELWGLDRTGVEEALRSMGAPLDVVGSRVSVVEQILRLSEGDPLLVGLYAESLWGEGAAALHLTTEALESLSPGLHGFFARWWRDQQRLWGRKAPAQRRAVRPVLSFLAGALGPLRTEDILWLSGEDADLDAGSLKEVVRALRRFVLGNGSEKTGYVFAHPRLAEYFWDEDSEEGLPASEQRKVELRFLQFGAHVVAELNAGRVTPERAPSYAVRHYGTHLSGTLALTSSESDLKLWEAVVGEGWWRAWLHLEGTYEGFLGDVDRAWQAAQLRDRTYIEQGELARHLGVEVLCSLCHARIAAQTGRLVPELIAALVQRGVWSFTQARAHIRTIRDPERRFAALAPLLKQSSESIQVEIAAEALHEVPWMKSMEMEGPLAELMHNLPEVLVPRACSCAQQISNEWLRVHALAPLVPRLPEALLAQLLRNELLQHECQRALLLAELAPHLPEGLIPEALENAERITEIGWKATVLASIAPRLPESLKTDVLRRTLQDAEDIEDGNLRVRVITRLAPLLDETLRAQVFAQALQDVQKIDDQWKAHAVLVLAPHVPETLLPEVLRETRLFSDERLKKEVLTALASRLPEALFAEVLPDVQRISDEWMSASALAALAPHLPGALLPQALQYAEQHTNKWARATAQASLAAYLPEAVRMTVRSDALKDAQLIERGMMRAEALLLLEPHLPEAHRIDVLNQELHRTEQTEDDYTKQQILTALAPRLPEALLPKALEVALKIGETWRAEAMAALAPHLSHASLHEALRAARSICDEWSRVQVSVVLASHLSKSLSAELLNQALQDAGHVADGNIRARALSLLAPYLPEALLSQALQAAEEIGDEGYRGIALAALAPYLPEALLARVLQDAERIEYEAVRQPVLIALAPHLTEALLPQALQNARLMRDGWRKAQVLAALTPFLPETLLHLVLQEAPLIEDEGGLVTLLRSLAPRLPEALLLQALQIAREIATEWLRPLILANIAPFVPCALRAEVLRHALHDALQISDAGLQINALTSLGPHLPGELLDHARESAGEWVRSEILEAVAPYLPEALVPAALQDALRIGNEQIRATVLATLAPRLSEALLAQVLHDVQLEDESARERFLVASAPHLPEALLPLVVQNARKMENGFVRAQVLAALSPRLSETLLSEVLRDVRLEDEGIRVWFLKLSAPHLPEALLPEALRDAQLIQDDSGRVVVLTSLAPRLCEQQLSKVITEEKWFLVPRSSDEDALISTLMSGLSPRSALRIWSSVLAAATPSLDGSVHRLAVLASIVGGEAAVGSLANALLDASRWWP